MKRSALAILPIALLASACAQTPPMPRTGDGMIDPKTQALDPKFVDQSFSLSDLYEDRIDARLPNSDRRAIDAAMTKALGQPPAEPAVSWNNPVTKTSGEIDLIRWEIDRRFGELCGSFQHEAKLPRQVAGAFILCRASTDPAWDLDEAVWRGAPATTTSAVRPRTPPPATVVRSDPPYNPPVASPPSTAGVRPPAYTPPPCPPGVGAGAQTLGDCLAAPN
ncbi:MAG: hypothetical protein ACFCUS_05645 [Rubrimonas sp.]|uniref:hypothetical protein n=1 Tax=Rubrimonas sp. TaxID=2036015 RepID=UPI002FDD56D0